jgi:hypothetical protein
MGFITSEDIRQISLWARQGHPLAFALFNLYTDEIIKEWQNKFRTNYFTGDTPLNKILFVGDQVAVANSEDNL